MQAIYKYTAIVQIYTMARCGNANEHTITIEKFFDEPTAYTKILKPRMMLKEIGKAVIIEYPLTQPEHEANQSMAQANKSIRPIEKIYITHSINKVKGQNKFYSICEFLEKFC